MNLNKSIKNLEDLYNSSYRNNNKDKCVYIINEIFDEIKFKNDTNFNNFLDELRQNFIIYFIHIIKNKKNLSVSYEDNEILKNKYLVGKIDEALVNQIKKILNNEIIKLFDKEKKGQVSRSDLTCSGGIKIRKVISLLNNFLYKNGHLNLVSEYLGYKSNISGLALELSSPKSNWWKHKKTYAEPKTLGVHLDKEFTCLKSIIYLTSVGADNGPFSIYPKVYDDLKLNLFQDIVGRIILETATNIKNESLREYLDIKDNSQPFLSENLQKIYSKLPEIISFNSHFGWELKSGSILEKKIIDSKIETYGEPGTMITFDGSRLLHSGGLAKVQTRLALQVIYSRKTNLISKYIRKIKNKLIK